MFTLEELALIPKICDLAVRHAGLEIAGAALTIALKAQRISQMEQAKKNMAGNGQSQVAQQQDEISPLTSPQAAAK